MDVSARMVENGNIRSINSYSALKIMELRRAIIMLAKIVVYIIFGRDSLLCYRDPVTMVVSFVSTSHVQKIDDRWTYRPYDAATWRTKYRL